MAKTTPCLRPLCCGFWEYNDIGLASQWPIDSRSNLNTYNSLQVPMSKQGHLQASRVGCRDEWVYGLLHFDVISKVAPGLHSSIVFDRSKGLLGGLDIHHMIQSASVLAFRTEDGKKHQSQTSASNTQIGDEIITLRT